MTSLVVMESEGTKVSPASLSALRAARAFGEVDALVMGHECSALAQEVAHYEGVSCLVCSDDALYQAPLPEPQALLVAQQAEKYTHILAAATTYGKDLLPRVAALLDVQQISEITGIVSPCCFERPIYAGNAIATVESSERIHVVTVRATAFEPCARGEQAAPIRSVDPVPCTCASSYVGLERTQSERPELTSARVVISGGRGVGSRENFSLLESLADSLGGAVGASRAAVDAGFAPNDYQVGQTGKVVAPELYVAVGISGALQHLAGMKDSKVIVAINKDENAPLMHIADYALVADLFDVLPALQEAIEQGT